jgi:multicomponent Na+:H+ antiporter subunit D
MCFSQRHIKRLLAFSTISHVGMFVCGIGLLSAKGIAGVTVYVIGHGLTKGALFMLSGVLVDRYASMDEFDLHGRGREMPLTGVLFALAGLVLSAIPVVTLFFGKSLLDAASIEGGYGWLAVIYVVASALTGGAVLRIAGRVFAGLGRAQAPDERQAAQAREEESEQAGSSRRTPPLMLLVPGVLLAGAIVVGLIPGAVPGVEAAAEHFTAHRSYIDWVLHGRVHFPPTTTSHVKGYDYLYGALAAAGAVGLAALALLGAPLRKRVPDALLRAPSAALHVLRELHSGHIGDYIAWWTAGAALFGGASLVFLR